MGRRDQRRRMTRKEKARGQMSEVRCQMSPEIPGQAPARGQGPGARGRINFEDLSPMTQGIVADIARRQRCTREEIVEVLND
jgi:hypothetical protein